MTRKHNALSTVTALFAGLATVHGLPATAQAAPSVEARPAPEVSPELLSAMRRDLGLSEDQLRNRLAFEAKAPEIEKTLRTELGDTFGGSWLSADGTQLFVGVTDEANAERVRRAGAVPKLVARSKAQLDRVMDELNANVKSAPASVHYWYVDEPTNTVVVHAEELGAAKARALSFVSRSKGATDGTIRVVPSTEAPRLVYDVRGGDAYYLNNVRCSIGFSVNGGFVTAGHCGGAGSVTRGSNNVTMGTVQASVFPTNDYAWVATNGDWVPQPWVYNYNNGNVIVSGSAEAGVGASICRSGSTTGWRCGTLEAKNITVNYSDGPVYGLNRTNACANPGDSGGSVISGNQAQGVTSGIAGGCETSAPQTFFQPINPILSRYGLTLKTNGGTSGAKSFVSRMNGKCIDVPNSNFSDGVQLQTWDCNGTNAQKFTFDGRKLRVGDKCVDVAWASSADGTAIQIANCSTNTAQDFVLSEAGDLVSYMANKCVDISGWNSASGAKLVLWTCTGGANQKWDFR
ncbi:ricin-type beta-trefoil lectin domain protein [Hyalangium versicolor]|uniref:ricin-type beta-trefoil lectin domain protein n=1 Tax=Hyalangium versicolor TaxID=2861190 RepID=UPI001CCC52A0|nr:ricin-type beta-trefoil lectin domain protein [Hyalangium versicolor]